MQKFSKWNKENTIVKLKYIYPSIRDPRQLPVALLLKFSIYLRHKFNAV